ncbi:serine/threonine protein kinase [Bacillus sp. 123MFChir2]|uniref:serine/threonine protein kinase n=1 Tax=Bacillus sp. 123MFChir2 TaxID=1169144 RepID=UPI0003829A2E|nr:protein kinase [Bacillus sp. 123MFChir2]
MNFQKVLAWFDRPLCIDTVVAQRYQIQRILGMGSYGFTYLVTDLLSGEEKVLKQLRKSKQRYASGRKSFTYEQAILQQVEHHAIPRFFHSFSWRKGSFFVMEEMCGKTFEDFIFEYGEMYTEKEVFLILYKVLYVVSYFHSQGIVHRDLRIPNILMNDDEIFIIDFGLARFIGENDERAHSYKGEQAYMREIHYRSDFYALGHFALFLLYSSYESSKEEQPWHEELTLSANSIDVIMRMLQMKEPYYENVQELIDDVRCIIERMGDTCSKSF